MANLNQLMRKLQAALLSKNAKIKVNQRQFYSEDNGRMMTCYSVTERKWSSAKRKNTDQEILRTCSMVEVVKFLARKLEELENVSES